MYSYSSSITFSNINGKKNMQRDETMQKNGEIWRAGTSRNEYKKNHREQFYKNKHVNSNSHTVFGKSENNSDWNIMEKKNNGTVNLTKPYETESSLFNSHICPLILPRNGVITIPSTPTSQKTIDTPTPSLFDNEFFRK